jgi:hypothetical protein
VAGGSAGATNKRNMSSRNDRAKTSIRNRHDPLKWTTDQDRAETLATRLTLAQQRAIATDTRLPGEIACTYKTTAAVILRIKKALRRRADW